MATIFSHSLVALAAGKFLSRERKTASFWILTAICASLPDLDVIGFGFGIQYGDVLGHRGLSHSLLFALVLGCVVASVAFSQVQIFSGGWWKLSAFFFLVTASHGILDAMTNGGLGVAFFAPFDSHRYFFPWRPIEVSPIGLNAFLSEWGLQVIISEIKWLWIPAGLLVLTAAVYRRLRSA